MEIRLRRFRIGFLATPVDLERAIAGFHPDDRHKVGEIRVAAPDPANNRNVVAALPFREPLTSAP